MTQQPNNQGNKGTNEYDVQIEEAKATNLHDVEIAKVGYDMEVIRKDAMLELEKYKTDKEHEYKRMKALTETVKGLGYAGMALAGYIIAKRADADVRKFEIEFGNK